MNTKDLGKIYRTAISETFPQELDITWGSFELRLEKSQIKLRYGTNPSQKAAFYIRQGSLWDHVKVVKTGKGGLSQTNISDVDRAFRILKYFNEPACAIMKHLVPSGFATSKKEDLKKVYVLARDCDPVAAFGGVVVFNRPVDEETAKEIAKTFVEVTAAPGYSDKSIKILGEKENLRILEYKISDLNRIPKFFGDPIDLKDAEIASLIDGSLISSDLLLTKIRDWRDVQVVTKRSPSSDEFDDLIFSWYVGIGVRSNGIVVSKDARTLGIGAGQQDRVTAVRLALEKAVERGHETDLKGSCLASDGFFPFKDSIDLAAKYGVRAIIQPGGSVKDQQVIEACDEYGIAMVFTGERTFGHF